MKRILLTLSAALVALACLASCSKDGNNTKQDFDYPLDDLYGTWDITWLQIDGTWYNVTSTLSRFSSTATFNPDGTYVGSGYFGDGSGTYKTKGGTITTYVDGEEYLSYTITYLSVPDAEGTIGVSGSSSTMGFKAEKRQ